MSFPCFDISYYVLSQPQGGRKYDQAWERGCENIIGTSTAPMGILKVLLQYGRLPVSTTS